MLLGTPYGCESNFWYVFCVFLSSLCLISHKGATRAGLSHQWQQGKIMLWSFYCLCALLAGLYVC